MEGAPFEASLKLALEAAVFFSLTEAEARQRADTIARQISGVWKDRMRGQGVTVAELRALEHAEIEQTLEL